MTRRSGRGTARQTVRLPEDLWERFGAAAAAAGVDRSALIREYVQWATGDPAAQEPRRLVEPTESE